MTMIRPLVLCASLTVLTACGAAVAGGYELAQNHAWGDGASDFTAEWDADGDGQVTLADLQVRRAVMFDMFDLNGDGGLDADERANMVQVAEEQREARQEGGGGHRGWVAAAIRRHGNFRA